MKKYMLILILTFTTLAHTQTVWHSDAYDADLCVHGKGGTWNGACACYEPSQYSGRYCTDKTTSSCTQNKNCPTDSYCSFSENTDSGNCFKKTAYPNVQTTAGDFVLSASIMNAQSAISFCQSLGENWKNVSRSDFECTSIGPACLKIDTLVMLKKSLKTLGFFWLEQHIQPNVYYYADLNDGTVYFTNGTNKTTMQALCIRKDTK